MKVIDFNYPPAIYWNEKSKIEYLQRFIIIHSIIYYELNSNCISDKDFDSISRQLVELQNNNKDVLKKTQYYYIFKDFDGSTGFYIYDSLKTSDKKYLVNIAKFVLNNYNRGV